MIELRIKRNSKWLSLYQPKTRFNLIYGPRLSGKSYRTSQASIILMNQWQYFRGYLMRNVLDTVRDSIFQDCKDRIQELELPYRITDLEINYGEKELKGRGFKKSSGQDTAKQKSLAGRNFAIIEEAEEVSQEDFTDFDLSFRTNKGQVCINLVFNPPEKGHWILTEWFDLLPATNELVEKHYGITLEDITDDQMNGFFVMVPKDREDTSYIFSSYFDNIKNLDPSVLKRIDILKSSDLNYYLHKIIGLVPSGKTGRIFKNYSIIDDAEYDQLPYNKLYGMDFGSNDPTVLVEVMLHDKNLYVREVFYERNLTIDDIDEQIKNIQYEITADSSAKQTIETLNARGRWVTSSVKGADSVVNGIMQLQGLNIHICKSSKNVIEEFENYCWKLDKFGLPTDTPEDKNNHAIDSIRYSIEAQMTERDYSDLLAI